MTTKKQSFPDGFQHRVSRSDRFAQMIQQEKIIAQKKKEILAKIESKKDCSCKETESKKSVSKSDSKTDQSSKEADAKTPINIFNNDGSFLSQFKNLKDTKLNNKSKDARDGTNKSFKWLQKKKEMGGKCRPQNICRFSDKDYNFHPKITINTSFNNPTNQQNFQFETQCNALQKDNINQISDTQLTTPVAVNITNSPIIKNPCLPIAGPQLPATNHTMHIHCNPISTTLIPPPPNVQVAPPIQLQRPPGSMNSQTPQTITGTQLVGAQLPVSQGELQVHFTNVNQHDLQVVSSQSVLLNATQLQAGITNPLLISSHVNIVSAEEGVNLQPNDINLSLQGNHMITNQLNQQNNVNQTLASVELSSIPAPNPIQVQNIPQPEPLNALNIPQPAPIQLQNIPSPAALQLNEIPNPKPLDLLTIPAPNDKNLTENNVQLPATNCLPLVNVQQPIGSQNISVQTIPSSQNILVHTVQQQLQPVQTLTQNSQDIQANNQISTIHISSLQNISNGSIGTSLPQNTFTPAVSVAIPMPNLVPNSMNVSNTIPQLLTQPILPPPSINITSLPQVNLNCPPPLLALNTTGVQIQQTSFLNQPPPISTQLPPQPQANLISMNITAGSSFCDLNAVFPPGSPDYEAMASLARVVAQCGPEIEEAVLQRKSQDESLWFLSCKESAAYQQYVQLVEQFRREMESENKKRVQDEFYDPEAAIEESNANDDFHLNKDLQRNQKRKRKSRWGDKDETVKPPGVVNIIPKLPSTPGNAPHDSEVILSKITRNDPGLIQYAIQTYNTTNLNEEDWKKTEDNYKIHLVYQEMVKKRDEVQRLKQMGKNKYGYDSDEETDGGTWEHKLREKEMCATKIWSDELTRHAEGKHHIGDFLPPDEYRKFMERAIATKEGRPPNASDYDEFKLKEDNIGFKMLQKLGWSEGSGLGQNGTGIVDPVNKGQSRESKQGLGSGIDQTDESDDEFESYRKRMMLAYRFRPNPLNNPRRPYY